MDLDDWLRDALADAERRGLSELRPLLETLARATRALRVADWNTSPLDVREGPADEDRQPEVAP